MTITNPEVPTMDLLARYVADQTEGGDEMVLDTSRDPARVVCMCRTDEDADMIARALNNQGAVEALEHIAEPSNWSPYHRGNVDSADKQRRAREALAAIHGGR